VTLASLLVAATRRRLEATYGLALEGVGEDQIASAIAAAAPASLQDPTDPLFLARVVDRLPIDESWLFREEGLWEWLRDTCGPALLDVALAGGRPVRILSLGCSGGQEAFSLAILFQGLLEQAGLPGSAAAGRVQVLGLDSSPARIEAARTGIVPGWSVQRARAEWLRGRVVPDDSAGTRWRVDPTVRAMCRFDVGNLVAIAERGSAALGGFDLVLCRHVLIYFRHAEAERLAARLAGGLDAGAVLVFSAAEAHLLVPGGLAPLGHLGAGRLGAAFEAAPREAGRRHAGAGRRPASAARRRPVAAGPAAPGAAAARAPRREAVAGHVRVALEHAHAGRTADALREVRAALFHDPGDLYSRLLLGQRLIGVDDRRARQVLRDLLESAAGMPADAEVPCAEGLCVGQLTAAARLILSRPGVE
jgi:chemotaxis methyl-accepting protein methylase